jgi:type IV secretory pathway VirB10-like protein
VNGNGNGKSNGAPPENLVAGKVRPDGISTVRPQVAWPFFLIPFVVVIGMLVFASHQVVIGAKTTPGLLRGKVVAVDAEQIAAKPTLAPTPLQVAQSDFGSTAPATPSPTPLDYNGTPPPQSAAPGTVAAAPEPGAATAAPTEDPAIAERRADRREARHRQEAADAAALAAPRPDPRGVSREAVDRSDPASYDVAPPEVLFLAPGTQIPIVLETSIDSTVTSTAFCSISGHTTADPVLDFFKRVTVLPPYTTACGHTAASAIAAGQARIGVVWDAFLLANGHLLKLDSPGTDRTGTMGFGGTIDEHQRKALARALVFSVISAAAQLAQPQNGSGCGGYGGGCQAGFGQSVAQGFGTQFQQLATSSYQRAEQTQPTLHVVEGSEVAAKLTAYLPVRAWDAP